MNKKAHITNLSNEELFELFKQDHRPNYFAELYRRYIPLLYGLCLKYLGNKNDAEDAVMDMYESLSVKITQYEITNFHSWLYSVAKNHCLQRIRQEKDRYFVEINETVMESGDFFTLLDGDKTNEEESALAFCMNELGKEQKTSIQFFYYENKSYADIVSLTGYTLEKVKSYIQNGKRNLKNCITRVLQASER